MPRTDTAPATAGPGQHDPFAVLLGKRISFGKLAELTRSHYTPDSDDDGWLDQLVDTLTDELETRFPHQWAQVEDHVYATEAMLFHIPYDPDTADAPVFLHCPRCRDLAAQQPARIPAARPQAVSTRSRRTDTAAAGHRPATGSTAREAS